MMAVDLPMIALSSLLDVPSLSLGLVGPLALVKLLMLARVGWPGKGADVGISFVARRLCLHRNVLSKELPVAEGNSTGAANCYTILGFLKNLDTDASFIPFGWVLPNLVL